MKRRIGLTWRVRAWARVWVYLASLSVIGTIWLVASAKNSIAAQGLELGRRWDGAAKELPDGNVVRVNGQEMHIAVQEVPQSAEHVLDFFERECAQNNVGLDKMAEQLPESERAGLLQRLGVSQLTSLGVTTDRQGEGPSLEGVVICVAANDKLRQTPVSTRFASFIRTGDLAELGEFRFVYAKNHAEREGALVRMIWTRGSFDVLHLFGGEGQDSPGGDPVSTPRPPQSVRLIDAGFKGQPYAIWVYDSQLSVEQALSFYEAELVKDGWTLNDMVTKRGKDTRHFHNSSNNDVVVLAAPNDRGGSSVTILEMSVGTRGLTARQ